MLRSVGIVIFDKSKKRVVLVKNVKGFWSFPKGHRIEGESELETAWREVKEETGLEKDDVKLLCRNTMPISINEKLKRGEYNKYFVGKLVRDDCEFTFSMVELQALELVEIDDALNLKSFKDKRKKILVEAYNYINE